MISTRIAARLADCLSRQVALYEVALAASRHVGDRSDADIGEQLSIEASFATKLGDLDREFAVLLKEWRLSEDLTDAERENVISLANHAESLTQELQRGLDDKSSETSNEKAGVQDEINRVRRGVRMLGKIASEKPIPPQFMDHKI